MPSWLGPAALLSPENALSPVEDCIQVFIGVLAPSRDSLCILLSKNDLAVHGYPHSSILAGDRMQGTVQNLLRERPVMSLEGQFSHGVCCHLAGAVLGGSSRVTFLSAIFLPPSSEAAKAWWRFSEGLPVATAKFSGLSPRWFKTQEPATLPLSGILCHQMFLPCNLLEASSTLVPHSTLVGLTGRKSVWIKGDVCCRLVGPQSGMIAPETGGIKTHYTGTHQAQEAFL